MKKIIVASKNPVKINATKVAFEKVFPQETFEVIGMQVPSFVSDQPMSDEETLEGAINRAENVKLAYNFYQTSASGGFSRSDSNSDNPNSSENSSSDGSSNSMGSRGFPHSSEGKAIVHNIELKDKDMSHGEIQAIGKNDIQKVINNRIDTYNQ